MNTRLADLRVKRDGAGTGSSGWSALLAPYLGTALVVIDSTVVNVALPSIQNDLHVSAGALAWMVNAYQVPYGGLMLLCGRLGDQYGYRHVLLRGIVIFLLASIAAAMATSAWMLVATRAAQGIGGAAITAMTLPLIWQQFEEGPIRARALAMAAFVGAAGGSAGGLLGGLLTSELSWRWIFWVNVPIGVIACVLWWVYPSRRSQVLRVGGLDVAGSVLITASITSSLLAVLDAATVGLGAASTRAFLCIGVLTLILFVRVERRARVPICPARLFRYENLSAGLIVLALWAAAQASWAFTTALYLQHILGYSALQTGLAFLPAVLSTGVLSVGVSTRVARSGGKLSLGAGLLLVTLGLALLAHATPEATFMSGVLPSMLLVGFGGGLAYSSFFLVALRGVSEGDHGVASGALSSAGILAGAVGLGFAASLLSALNSGYHVAFASGATCAAAAALIGFSFLRYR